MKTRNRIKYGFLWILAGAAMITIMGLATMYLWNWLIPTLFAGPTILFIEALGILVLAKILTHGFGRGGSSWKGRHSHGHCSHCGHGGHEGGYWKGRWEDKMKNMTPEEKEKFKNYYYDRCGWRKHPEENQPEADKTATSE